MIQINSRLWQCSWLEAREKLISVNPNLVKVVDSLDPPSDFRLYMAKYFYGDLILNQGQFHLPSDDKTCLPITDTHWNSQIQQDLGYSASVPLGVPIDKGLELYIHLGEFELPCAMMEPGRFFATTVNLDDSYKPDKGSFWSMAAGTRSTFMIPKIGNNKNHNHLKKAFGTELEAPKTSKSHFSIFRELQQSLDANDRWSTEIIFFNQDWLHAVNNTSWGPWTNLVYSQAWGSLGYRRFLFMQDAIISKVLNDVFQKQDNRLKRPNAQQLKTINHLIAITASHYPGFGVATDEEFIPLEFLQNAYLNIYGLDTHLPTIMVPKYFNPNSDQPVYYSLQKPTIIDLTPKHNELSTCLDDLKAIRKLIMALQEHITEESVGIYDRNFPIYSLVDKVSLDYMHTRLDPNRVLTRATRQNLNDPAINAEMQRWGYHPKTQEVEIRDICLTSNFFDGVIKMSGKT